MEPNETKIWTVLIANDIDRAFISFDKAIKHRNKLRRDHPNFDVKMRWAILEGEAVLGGLQVEVKDEKV